MYEILDNREFKMGVLLAKNGFQEEALDKFSRILLKDPICTPAMINAGVCCRQLGRFDLSQTYLQLAWDIVFVRDNASDKKMAHALATDLGSLYEDLGDFDLAKGLHRTAFKLFPELPATNINYAYCLMREGRWLEAWPKWEWGRSPNAWAYPETLPRWTGKEDLSGKKLLVCREGGYGDVFMYMRWFPQIRKMGATIHLWAWRSLETLLNDHWAISEFLPTDENTILERPGYELQAEFAMKYDYYVPLMSIPACLKADRPPRLPGYPAYMIHKLDALHSGGRNRVGLCWKAEENSVSRKHRSLPDSDANKIVESMDADWISLIPGTGLPAGMSTLDSGVQWRETVIQMSSCDLVISVDSAVAHLAGSLGIPCWWMLPLRRDWKHGLPANPTVWYPGQRNFNQADPISWDNVIDEVAEALHGN